MLPSDLRKDIRTLMQVAKRIGRQPENAWTALVVQALRAIGSKNLAVRHG